MAYSLPHDVFVLLETAFNQDHEKAGVFAKAIEGSIQSIETQANEQLIHKKEVLKSELYNELRTELATKEFVRAEISEVKAEIKHNALLLKILIGVAIFGLTLFNPAFVKLIELLLK